MSASSVPHALRAQEWDEVAALGLVKESWGLSDEEPGKELSSLAFGVRFDFYSPGYHGDLYIIHGDTFAGPPLVLVRDHGRLVVGPNHGEAWPT